MKTKEYLILLGKNARKRHHHTTESGQVVGFTVQLEIYQQGKWRTVLRYDTSHGFAHVDRYNIKGKQTKSPLSMNFSETLTYADADINKNWENYIKRFLKGLYP